MRISPTRQQMAYLASVGVTRATIAQPDTGVAQPTEESHTVVRRTRRRVILLAILLMIIVLLVSLSSIVNAQDPQPAGSSEVTVVGQVNRQGDLSASQRLDALETEIAVLRETGGYTTTREELSALQRQLTDIEQQLTSLRDSLLDDLAEDQRRITRQIQFIQSGLDELKANLVAVSASQGQRIEEIKALVTSTLEKTDDQLAQAKRTEKRQFEMELGTLHASLDQQRQDFNRAVIFFVVITVLGISLLIIGRILMEKRIRQVEQSAISRLNKTAATTGGYPKAASEPTDVMEVTAKTFTDKNVNIEPTRPRPRPLPTPIEQMQTIIATAAKFRHIRVKPTLSSEPWELGLATNKGNVRSENQDFGLSFQINGNNVLIVADGCGGVPLGGRAARLVALSAAASVVRNYGMAQRWHVPHVKDAAAKAIKDAAHRLAVEGDKLNITDVRGGLRTTLIVIIGNKREVGYAYIGDGGGCVVKSSGEVHRFLNPQKANDFAMNVLAASLGPMMEGDPVTGVLKHAPGDILIIGTDGVFDRIDKEFPKDVLRGCIQYKGDLQLVAEHIITEMASQQDKYGYICDDNLTLGIMGDGTTPKLSPGFWSPVKEAVVAPVDVTSPEAVNS